MNLTEDKYLSLLAAQYPTLDSACAEIINLSSVLNLPKGTEHFISDIHGEYKAFSHVIRNASGSISRKIDDEFGESLPYKEKRTLATLIYYPEEKYDSIKQSCDDFRPWCKKTIMNLVRVMRRMASKYTKSRLRSATLSEFEYIIEELMTEREELSDRALYYDEILEAIIDTGRAKAFITALSGLIQYLAIDRLHVIGDIYDRGSGAVDVMDALCDYHSVDIEWGNHDISWMGAASGCEALIFNVIRISARYGNLSTIEDGYGINLIPLLRLAQNAYADDPCEEFTSSRDGSESADKDLNAKIHKAALIIQLKLEGQMITRHPEFDMSHRVFLDKIDYERCTVTVEGVEYNLRDGNFPTVDPSAPFELSDEELRVVQLIKRSFLRSEKLQRHVSFLFSNGGMYKIYNGNLLYHGCIPMNSDGSFRNVLIGGKSYSGRALLDELERQARLARFAPDDEGAAYARDMFWFIWSHENSPLFGKNKMATFESYFLPFEASFKEKKNPYYRLIDDKATVDRIFDEFGIDKTSGHIINGHVPVKVIKGESPIHLGGRVLIIDGGFSTSYRDVTGIAGYTLISNSRGMRLVALEPFVSIEDAVEREYDVRSLTTVVDTSTSRVRVESTDAGARMKSKISDLTRLIELYKMRRLNE